jgi:serine/threonine protein kinase
MSINCNESGTTVEQTSEHYFHRYRVKRELGRGRMGVVLLAHDEKLDKDVALKLLPIEVACDSETMAGLKREIYCSKALLHPGAVRTFGIERDANELAIAMEYIAGETLADRRRGQRDECFDCDEVFPWIKELCEVLHYAHSEMRITHRDLKPRNIMLTAAGHVKVADFGISAGLLSSFSRDTLENEPRDPSPYQSPQQMRGEAATCSDDIYACGAIIYELLTGKPPFYRGNVRTQTLYANASTMERRRMERGIGGRAPIPLAWEEAVAACLAKDPADRPPTIRALFELLCGERVTAVRPREHRIVRARGATGACSPARVADGLIPARATKNAEALATALVRRSKDCASPSRHRARGPAIRLRSRIITLAWAKWILALVFAAAVIAMGIYLLR